MPEHDPSNDRWGVVARHGGRAARDHEQRPQEEASDDGSGSQHPRRRELAPLDAHGQVDVNGRAPDIERARAAMSREHGDERSR